MCHGFFGGGFGMFGIMGMAGGILRLAVFCLIAVTAVYAIRWFIKNKKQAK
jgi:uncharacterized membrane protein